MANQSKEVTLSPFYRGDTPILVVPVTLNGGSVDISDYSGFITFNTSNNPSDNTDAFLHKRMTTDAAGDLINPSTGLSFGPNFYYQFTNTDTEQFDPAVTYHWDVQINKSPQDQNNFTIAKGTFAPIADIGRGLT